MEDRDSAAGAATKYSTAPGAFRGSWYDARAIDHLRPLK